MNRPYKSPVAEIPDCLLEEPGITVPDLKVYAYLKFLAADHGNFYATDMFILNGVTVSYQEMQDSFIRLAQRRYIRIDSGDGKQPQETHRFTVFEQWIDREERVAL